MRELIGRDIDFRIRSTVNELVRGRTNAVGSVTLTASATSTTLTDQRLMPTSVVFLSPATASAATAMSGLYIDTYAVGSCVIHHASSAATDQTFNYVILTGGEG